MTALLFNLHSSELLIIALVAILVFGRRLPEVAAQAANGLGRLRAALEKMRQETGIDREIREVQRSVNQGLEHVRARDLQRAAQERILSETGLDAKTRREVVDVAKADVVIHDPAVDPGIDPFTPAGELAPAADGEIQDPAAPPDRDSPASDPASEESSTGPKEPDSAERP